MNNTIFNWFEEAVPNPTAKNFNIQLGVHLEEFYEMLDTIKCEDRAWETLKAAVFSVAYNLKAGHTQAGCIDLEGLLDAMCDQVVTATGVAYMAGSDFDSALAEVNRSNWSKFENGKAVFDENGKIKKGANYSRPAIGKYVQAFPRE